MTKPPDARPATTATLDSAEVARFGSIAAEWWDPTGKFAPLHRLGPARMTYLRDRMAAHFERPLPALRPFTGLRVLDIGCGGGLVSEPLARLGASVTGLDPSADNIAAARAHAVDQGLAIDYRAVTAEMVRDEGATFDAVLFLEVVEHVPDPASFVRLAASLCRPGGLVIGSTINRTLKAWALAIIGAEYVLRWLPAGTHRWDRFVTPDEMAAHMAAAGLSRISLEGLVYDPLGDRWSLSPDTDVNYFAAAVKADG
ncbi:MAG: bifunctional 2-polyprenyl-6-hydroxyphenol methylase/3-demethylubiquinol 3-O-methyltransferase UbiG [Hyphomicrobiaceae bacterium]|nr:bifunctional 2-polyprenyl-6-hydroxyphenol methylase/3-demethylubiquinol 3-O-methyltransferase UbiG [Hyphomicrobiaceae bacterium]